MDSALLPLLIRFMACSTPSAACFKNLPTLEVLVGNQSVGAAAGSAFSEGFSVASASSSSSTGAASLERAPLVP